MKDLKSEYPIKKKIQTDYLILFGFNISTQVDVG